MCELDDNIVVNFDAGKDYKAQYIQCMQCRICKQLKCVDEFVSKQSKRLYNKSCRACLNNNENLGLKGRFRAIQ